MTGTMAALVYEAPRVMTMREVAVPTIGATDVLIRVAYSGICGSELSGFLGQSSIRTPPLVFGHEVSGNIVVVGDAVDDNLAIGTAVTVNPLISCGRCRYCVAGRQQLCPSRLLLGASLPGCNSEFVRVPGRSVLPLPEGMSLESAAMVEPMAFALNAVGLSRATPTSSALVIGAGAIGLCIMQVLMASGVDTCFVVERNPARLAMASGLGGIALDPEIGSFTAQIAERGGGVDVDVAFDAVGAPETRRHCLSAVSPGGTVVLAGLHSDLTELPLNTLIRSEITLVGAFAYTPSQFATSLNWLAQGRVGLRDGLVRAPLHDGQLWYERLVEGHPASKVLLEPTLHPVG
ncbi:MAG: alcohol dehydrogenase catalytic domain-containing protein [Actinobacteria bacterium]|nr:alcohol dehydrogenase catalytic domain-containing protein [Actinomycetota bacterium]